MYSSTTKEFDIIISHSRAKLCWEQHALSIDSLVQKEIVNTVGFANQNVYAVFAFKRTPEFTVHKVLHLSVKNKIVAPSYVLNTEFENLQNQFLNQK